MITFKEFLSQLPIKEIAIGLAVFGIGLWIVYRPYLKAKDIIFEFLKIRKPGPYKFNRDEMKRKWESIEDLLDGTTISSWKLTLEEVYKFFEFVLEKIEPDIPTTEERLKTLSNKGYKLERVKRAMQIKNNIAKENGYKIKYSEIQDALKRFKECLRELGAL